MLHCFTEWRTHKQTSGCNCAAPVACCIAAAGCCRQMRLSVPLTHCPAPRWVKSRTLCRGTRDKVCHHASARPISWHANNCALRRCILTVHLVCLAHHGSVQSPGTSVASTSSLARHHDRIGVTPLTKPCSSPAPQPGDPNVVTGLVSMSWMKVRYQHRLDSAAEGQTCDTMRTLAVLQPAVQHYPSA